MSAYLTQYTEISRALDAGVSRQGEQLERLRAQIHFADQLRALHPDESSEWERLILEAGRLVADALRASALDLDRIVADGEQILAPIGAAAKEYELLCVSHAHIDMNWMWSWPETVAVCNDTFDTMLKLMDEFPEFIFSQSQASVYLAMEQYNPAQFQAIRQRVSEGRWEVTASQWVEGDKNMASGESITRHLLYTREYFQEKFGLSPEDVTLDYEPDTFGHPATLPTILNRGGVKYYYHCRGSRGPHLYWWDGPDDSRLLTLNGMPWYMGPIEPKIADPLISFSRDTGLKYLPVQYGVGDHGGGPTRRDLRNLDELNTWPVFPQVKCSSWHAFFRRAAADARDLPVITGERNFVFTGCYTSQARQKWANRHNENLLYTAEAAAAIGERVAGVEYPGHNLDEAWKHVLFDQFHDILPGSGMRDTRHYAMAMAQEGQAAGGMARTNALRALGKLVNTESLLADFRPDPDAERKAATESGRAGGAGVGHSTGDGGESSFGMSRTSERAFLIFNPLPYARTEVVEAKLWDTELDRASLVVTGEGVEPQLVQVLGDGNYWGHAFLDIAFPVEVPALGYRAVCISDRAAELGLKREQNWEPWGGSIDWRRIEAREDALENDQVRAVLDAGSGGLTSLVDKGTGREWVPAGQCSGIFQYCLEQNQGMTAWTIGRFLERRDLAGGGKLSRLHSGPWLNAYRWTRDLGNSKLELDITLRHGSPRVEYRLNVDWRQIGDKDRGIPHLKVRFPLAASQPTGRYEIPFGALERDLTEGEEVPAIRWAEMLDADGQGVVLGNTSKYGFNIEGDSLNMTLLRGSIDPDPLPDLGEHIIEYSIAPHGPGWAASDSVGEGEQVNLPLVVASCDFQAGDLAASHSFASMDPGPARLVALKRAQDGKGVVLRLAEVDGLDTEVSLTLDPALAGARATLVDAVERPMEGGVADLRDGVLTVQVPAGGITAVRLA